VSIEGIAIRHLFYHDQTPFVMHGY